MEKKLYDLTNPQRNIWNTEEFFKGTSVNNICAYGTIDKKVDFELLKKAVNLLVKQNDSFRLKFTLKDNIPMQYLDEYVSFNIETVEISSEEELKNLADTMAQSTFNLIDTNLFDFKLFKYPDGRGGVLINIHHLISDAWSLSLTIKEIIKNYYYLENNLNIDYSYPSYIDYSEIEKEYLNGEKYQKDANYWKTLFSTIPEIASIPATKHEISSDLNIVSNRKEFTISSDILNKIKTFCSENSLSLFNFFMSIFSIYIGRVCRLDDFTIGSPILNRTNFDLKHTTGMFISTVPLRFSLKNDDSFINFSKQVAINSSSMLRHQRYPYSHILEHVRSIDSSVPNLYDILISYQITNTTSSDLDIPYKTSWFENGSTANGLNIHLFDINDTGNLNIAYDYQLDKYSESDISSMNNRIIHLISQVLKNNNILLNNLEIVTPEEKHALLYDFNNTHVEYDKSKTIIEIINDIARINPNKVAIEDQFTSITYGDLISRVNKLSNKLIIDYNLKSDTNIGIFTNRTIDVLIGILSILRIGSTYVPIDPNYPTDRINHMINTSLITTILTDDLSLKDNIENKGINYINIDYSNYSNFNDNFTYNVEYNINNNLYIVFTSGSTGTPKGVTLSQKNMLNLINFEKLDSSLLNGNNRILQFATMSFDVSYQEIFSALLTTSTLVLVDEDIRKNSNKLMNYLVEKKIDTLFIPPAYLTLLSKDVSNIEKFKLYIKNIITAGEQLIITDDINKLLTSGIKIYNHYGPAETHVVTTYKITDKNMTTKPPIGFPISNSQVYILDQSNQLCPIGAIGQIVLSGDCVGNGYFNNDDSTKQKFIKNPFFDGIMYLTGDLGYIDNLGCIHYEGRMDFQVKINGFRIELEEIDRLLAEYKNIKSSISIVQTSNNKKHIITYYTSSEDILEKELLSYLKKKLPVYMLPSKLVKIESMPLNPNGKIDRKSLPAITLLPTNSDFINPKSKTEIDLANIWKELFKISKISTTYDFFEIGGDSLLAIEMSSKILNTFNLDISVKEIFENSIFADLALLIFSKKTNKALTITHAKHKDSYSLSSAQKRIYYASKKLNDSILYNISGGILIDKILDKDRINEIFNTLINMNSSFRTCFKIINAEPKQVVLDSVNFKIDCFNSSESNINSLINNFPKPFNLETAPLLRISICYLDNTKTLLLIDSHHIILDGASLDILINDFCKLYNENLIETNSFEYVDYSEWENNFIISNEIKPIEKYWVDNFKNSNFDVINLPYDYSSKNNKFNGNRISKVLPNDLFKKINQLSQIYKVSPYMLFLSAFYILLYKYTGQDNIIIGSPISGRDLNEFKNIIGMFVNNIALNVTISHGESFTDFLNNIKSIVLDALSNQPYPFDMLCELLKLPSGTSLFDVMFTYQSTSKTNYTIDECNVNVLYANTHTSKFNLSLEVIPNIHTINIEYNTDLFKEETIQSFMDHYLFILNQILSNQSLTIDDFQIITENEKKLLCTFNNTSGEINNDTVVTLFEKQVKQHPNNIAIICENKKLTYKELNEKANSLAHYLISNNIHSNDIICIMTNRSFETIVSMLAILKAGAAFFNVDPTYPLDRTQYYLEDSKTQYVLTQKCLKDTVQHIKNCIEIDLDNTEIYDKNIDNLNIHIDMQDLSYVIYTSGSTGTPKGVMLNQIGFANMAKAMTLVLDYLKEGNAHTLLSVTSTPFDIFVYEIIVSLTHGLKVVMANNAEHRNPKLLDTIIKENNVDVMTVTPSLMKILYDNREPNSSLSLVKNMVFGGEPLPENFVKDLHNLAPDITIYNIYGPSEITILSNVQNLNNEKEITTGPPILNTQIHILDKNMNQVPIGVVGEIYISGIQVGLGYIGKPELTAEKFLDNKFGPRKNVQIW